MEYSMNKKLNVTDKLHFIYVTLTETVHMLVVTGVSHINLYIVGEFIMLYVKSIKEKKSLLDVNFVKNNLTLCEPIIIFEYEDDYCLNKIKMSLGVDFEVLNLCELFSNYDFDVDRIEKEVLGDTSNKKSH